MFSLAVVPVIKSIIPNIATQILEFYKLNNYYAILISTVLQEIITYISKYLSDEHYIVSIIITFTFLTMLKYGLFNKYSNIIYKNDVIINSMNNMLEFMAINKLLLKKKVTTRQIINYGQIAYITNYLICLNKNIYVSTIIENNEDIKFILTTKNENILDYLNETVYSEIYQNKKYNYKIIFSEDKIYDNEIAKNITLYLKHKYKMKTNKCLIKDNIDIYMLDTCENYKLNDLLNISIYKFNNLIIYILLSNEQIFLNFINECTDCSKNKTNGNKYTYMRTLSATNIETTLQAPTDDAKSMISLTHYVLQKNKNIKHECKKNNNDIFKIIYPILTFNKERHGTSGYSKDYDYVFSIDNIEITVSRICERDIGITTLTYHMCSNIVDVYDYVEMCENYYNENIKKKNKNKIYCFKYNNYKSFTTYLLSNDDQISNETFNNIYSEHNDILINDIKRLKDDKYYSRTGMRRKKSYIFYGEPGCGKNASVLAMALYDGRHIIDIPSGTIQTNSEFERLLNMTEINGIIFKKSEIIIMFDELDLDFDINDNNSNDNMLKLMENVDNMNEIINDKLNDKSNTNIINKISEKNIKSKKKDIDKIDKLNIGNVLSLLDGICNYSGLIIVAMTNNKENLPKALCRDLRLTPIYFTYLRQIDVINLLEKFFELKLEDSQKSKIPDRKLSPAKCRLLCEKYEKLNINDFINILNN